MANILSLLNTIKTAIYGRDMRLAIHDSIKAVNDDTETRLKISGGTMTGGITMNGNKITSSATPSSNIDLTNKQYVDEKLAKKVDNTQYASTSEYGLVKLSPKGGIIDSEELTVNTDSAYGTSRTGDGKIMIVSATKDQINSRTYRYNPIVPSNIDYAVAKSLKQASEYVIKYEDDIAYITNKPDSLPIGLYIFTPIQTVHEVHLTPNETDLAYVTGIFSVGITYIIDFDTAESKVLVEINNKSIIEQWVQNNYLPLSGGEMNKGSIIGIQSNTDSRKTILTSGGVKLIPSKSTEGSYAFGLSYRKTDDSDVIGGIGAFGTGDNLQYYYMGTYDNPLLKVSSSGSLAMKNNIYRPDYSFLLRYYQQSDEEVVAVKLGNFKTYDSKATIDILGRNLFNGKQAGGKYTLTLSFNSNATSGFNAGGILYYYGDFFGSTGNVDTTVTPISVQLVQSEDNRANCDVYILLNKPAQYPIFSIDVNCLSDTTWTKDVQWITDTADIPEVDGTTSYIVATKNVAFEDSTVDRAIADKNGDDITENYARLHNSSKTPYDTGRVWLNGEPIMRQDYCVVVKKGSTAWNDGSINYSDCINDSNTQYSGILQWTAFGNYTNVPTSDSGTYDINPIDYIRLNIDADGRNIDFDISESAPYDCIVIAGYIEYVADGADIPQSSITKIIE